MANLAGILKEEIARHARKEVRAETSSLKKASVRYRADIAALKRRVALLEQQVSKLGRLIANPASPVVQQAVKVDVRFSPTGLRKHRERLGLSAPALASLFGVSPQTIYNWETAVTRPSPEQIARIAILRGMSKREVQARLEHAR